MSNVTLTYRDPKPITRVSIRYAPAPSALVEFYVGYDNYVWMRVDLETLVRLDRLDVREIIDGLEALSE